MTDKRLFWIWLMLVFGPANPRIWQLSKHYDSAENFVNSLMSNSVKDLTDREVGNIRKTQMSDAKKLLEYCNDKNINVYSYESEGYPEKLRVISNPPAVLFSYGNLDFLNDKVYISVVGTRKPSDYSLEVAEKVCQSLIKRNILLVSGFASGIDQIANRVSLDNGVPTVAVCGRPLEEDYPKGSDELKMKIAQNGAVISEYYPGCKPYSNAFLNRNRILTGIADGVLFCECSAQSHGLDNAKHAEVQGKPIFVIPPHDIFDARYFGQRDLIRNGAVPVFDGADIAYDLSYERLENMSIIKSLGEYTKPAEDSVMFAEDMPDKKRVKPKKAVRVQSAVDAAPIKKADVDYSDMSEIKQKICRALEQEELHADEIAEKTGEDIADVLSELIELELDGIVTALAGKMYGIV